MSYVKLVKRLFAETNTRGMKLGLSNCLRLHHAMGRPCDSFKSIHVAGTNGKGSVTAKIAAGMQAAGYRVGRYVSPHIATFRERMSINGEMISEAEVVEILNELFAVADREKISPTFFELTTLLAFCFFAQKKADIAVLETGLGGRLDATNIVHPILSVITSISVDHTEILGHTLEEIAKEKAGIIKSHVPVLIGPSVPHSIIQPIADELKSPLYSVSGTFFNPEQENCAIAERALQHLQLQEENIQQGLLACLPCRYEKIQTNIPIFLDVAHNPAGVEGLLKRARKDYSGVPFHIVCGFSRNKDLQTCLHLIAQEAKHIYLVSSTGEKAAPVSKLEAIIRTFVHLPEEIHSHLSIQQAVILAMRNASQDGGIVLICGTFYIMRDARMALGISEPIDPLELRD
ncbi:MULTISPECIES: bifunctional folylpolyglutamate synthase/dihydrofolate synthase [Parachlamydia]|jgi:dihydrofolate synthase/folylpolyglutamate synthase|uniref:bifunctional folylpolyglutamate synthase/dihydrofolate synthase n=1 Tax=Parachlamydia TaxID=83551 RepID=UPI0002F677A5|nr:Mur ligase family protein [Parachlamydia acanthamoebae]